MADESFNSVAFAGSERGNKIRIRTIELLSKLHIPALANCRSSKITIFTFLTLKCSSAADSWFRKAQEDLTGAT